MPKPLYDPVNHWGLPPGNNMTIDDRHAFMLSEMLRIYPFRRVLEIGCYRGNTTVAVLEAQTYMKEHTGSTFHSYHCDPHPQPEFDKIIEPYVARGFATVYRAFSFDMLNLHGPFDAVFVDGNHAERTVREETDLLIQQKTLAVFAHDTTLGITHNLEDLVGPQYLKNKFMATAPYLCLEDCVNRLPKEWTNRGFFAALRTPELFEKARGVYAQWCGV